MSGQGNTVHSFKQWKIQVSPDGNYAIVNEGENGKKDFYQIVSGQYGQPLIVAEPDRAVVVPQNIQYVDTKGSIVVPDQKIAGFIIRDANKQIVMRVSLTNAEKKGILWELDDVGVLKIAEQKYCMQCLVIKDKNRLTNYDAFFGPESVSSIKVLELEDLVP